ncbi:MAG: hypothetical protein ACKO5K_11130, partial [Armatimonadota bacterium]
TGKCVVQAISQTTGELDSSKSLGNASYTVDVTDGDLLSPKGPDAYGIRVVKGDGTVWYATIVNGSVGRRTLGGGNVLVKSK